MTKIPDGVSLVVANSLTPSPKLLSLGTRYNMRVVECRFALLLLAFKLGVIKSVEENSMKILYDL